MEQHSEKHWYVLYTKPRHEKKVAERLTAAGYTVYCPSLKVVRRWSDRTKVVEEPLFKGYVFVQTEDHRRDEIFTYTGTVRYLFWLRRPAIVREEEITSIQKWLGHYEHQRFQVSDITPGAYVRITSGKFMNEEGILLDTSNSKAVVQLKELGIQLSLDLTQNELQALQHPSKKRSQSRPSE
jgi:transcriptional antiterminator RfaH